ncbi:MAG: riboflavin biosynthesis protein RibD [Bacteroidetes bacterium GWA2_32_17]|nr:MAG: riboflavin biosynthesis protein RibD [Bacteroidetes bacterium GWA2_32_17]
MNFDQIFMYRCIELAKSGLGNTSPNPIVGCVITYNNKIIGEGYHQKYGEAHAEVNAINSVKDKELLKKSILYVTLEPCSHFGKTPPCTDLIVKMKIPRVVISCSDPNPQVSGKGIKILQKAGIEVKTGILKDLYEWENRRFFTFHNKKRSYIILKWAKTKDGFIDVIRNNNVPNINRITNETCKTLVHKWRTEEQAILIGTKTAINDNPELTVRNYNGKNPLRIVIDKDLTLPQTLKVFNKKADTLIITEKNKFPKTDEHIKFCALNFDKYFEENLLNELYKLNIQSIIIEGGLFTLNSFINKNLWDEARVFTGNKKFEKGLKAPVIKGKLLSKEKILDCGLEVLKNNKLKY